MARRAFFIRDKRPLCYFHDHHNDDRIPLWCPAPPGVQEELVNAEPERFFKPPMSTRATFSEWLGVFLDASGEHAVDWGVIAAILERTYRHIAPKELIARLDDDEPTPTSGAATWKRTEAD